MKYRLSDRIGSGGMAEVFRATGVGPEGFERAFVVKRIHPHLSHAPEFVRMFVDEAKISARILHPNVVQVFEFTFYEGSHYIVMEPVDGVDMARVVRRLEKRGQVAPPTFVAELGRQVCRGLDFAHTLTDAEGRPLGIVHRDVTPPNIMVGWNGTAKILDFGLARAVHERRSDPAETGTLKGKMSYFAPEQLEGRPADARSDLFSLGVVLHELLSGQRLFLGENDLETLRMVREMPVPRPSLRNREVEPALEAAVMRALARDPEQRFRSAAEMADALDDVVLRRRYSTQAFARDARALFPDSGPAGDTLAAALEIGADGPTAVSSARTPARVPWLAAALPLAALAAFALGLLVRHLPRAAGPAAHPAPNVEVALGPRAQGAMITLDAITPGPAPPALGQPCVEARRHRHAAALVARRSSSAGPRAPGASAATSTPAAQPMATVRFRNDAGDSFHLVEAHFVIDDRPLPALTGSPPAEDTVIYAGPVRPGRHVVSARLVYQGSNRGPFTYLSGYKVNVESRKVLEVPAGRPSSFTIATENRNGLNVPLEKQLAVTFRDDSPHAMR